MEFNHRIYSNDLLETKSNHLIKDISKVDIVIPIYNAFDFMKVCIESVYKNTEMPYDLYLINDCSTDERVSAYLNDLRKGDKPHALKNIFIIENEENLGFIKSVNKVMALGTNHVVLLNTDTEVPFGWLRRLVAPVAQDSKIASVTPFSNCATICSFPNICKDNDMIEGLSLSEIDCLFDEYGGEQVVEIPTGVGFCMLLNRNCLSEIGNFDVIYGKGYGEENDWCMRAYQHGYKNIMITNLFVYHKHGASFSEHKDKAKEERMRENLRILNERYPEYSSLVNLFIAKDLLKRKRVFMKNIIKSRIDDKEQGVLFINHSLGGGTKIYQERLISAWKTKKRLYGIEMQVDYDTIIFTDYNVQEKQEFYFSLTKLTEVAFQTCIKAFNINLIYINQLITYPLEKMISLVKYSKVPYKFFIHDFYSVCPLYTMVGIDGIYCGAEKEEEKCNLCLRKNNMTTCKDIKQWRLTFHKVLSEAQEVIVPSESTALIIGGYYPDIKINIKEHALPSAIYKSFDKKFAYDKSIKVAFIGSINKIKGSDILYELAGKIKENHLPIEIKVFGITDRHNTYYKSEDKILEILGKYDNLKISTLLAQYRIGIVFTSSICPETFSYTTNEALYSGYPVIAFDLGAPAEKIKKNNCGWVLEEINITSILALLERLHMDRNEILEKANREMIIG